jgi:copper resistance protein D
VSADQALILCRFWVDACALLLWGAQGFLWVGVSTSLAAKLHTHLATTTRLAAVLLAVAALAKIPLQAAILGNGWPDALNPSLIHDLVTATRSGVALSIQAALALILMITSLRWSAHHRQWNTVSTTILAGLTLASLSISGHAAMNSGDIGLLHQLNDSLHVLAVGAWVGALLPVLLLLTIRLGDDDQNAATHGLMRFSTLGHGAVLATLITGLLNSRLVIGTIWLNMDVPYQQLLLLKIVVVVVMIALACINRYVFVPRLGQERERALQLLRLGTAAEIGLSLLAIGLVATFGVMEPI